MSLILLPNEILSIIAGYLNTQDIASLRSSNKHIALVLHISLYDSIYRSGSFNLARKALYYAIVKKDYWLVRRLIDQKVDTLVSDGALLNDAIRRKHSLETIQSFIDCGAKLNTVDGFGITPLAAAAVRGRLDLVQLLLSKNAEVKMESMTNSPLVQAARAGHLDIFQVLLNYPGTHISAVDHYGRSLLHWIIFASCPESVSVLIHNPTIDINKQDMGGCTPLAVATEMNYNHIARILLSDNRTDVNLADSFANTPLHKAARRGNLGLVQMLMERDEINRNPINHNGMSPLMIAQSFGKHMVADLMEKYMSQM